ncbi:PAS/PAC sensor signal transduction histidine kinase [Nitrosomonas cryotolerans]|uniref:Phosphate regulon sensor protein PhoR n=1 Tax=Nitrosomonas cryotolerans ATCC 49181 TaxID=1131553 RepID=A0A1N6I2I4_9PROT|nr:phosphate regulon sensor histidine kinase PhoR [Nitrosomonas cryotolerans]SFP58922.1 PAS/PAC sensor signal transduction histidine kinase [Nitrosomonas cryotolerans]SIO26191.1 PAS/PAC sensor signal transduction histidine kinase [Nitrosomonas cryotolerans ATCC 49181]
MSDFWQRFSGIIFVTFITALLWAALGAAKALMFYSIILLWLVIYHLRNLAALDRWLQLPELTSSTIPDSSGSWGDVLARLARYVRRHSQSQQKLSMALERIQRATSAMPNGIVILNEKDRIEWCNPMAEQHLGVNLKLDAGQQITYLVRQLQFVEYLATRDYSNPLVLKQMHYHQLTLSLQLVPYGDKQKLLISQDITHLERIETMRRDFIANVSHELRTPLTVIGGFLETLSEENNTDSDVRQRALALMSEHTTRMQRLVEDLLMLSRLENAQNIVSEKNINIVEMLHDLSQEAESLSAGRHQISLNLATDAQLLGSEDELRSAFANLVSNAVRYTPEGGEIMLHWMIHEGQGLFSVQDSGIGIGSEHIPRLTERFYRVDNSRSRETGGTGLGLAIVKHIANRHQARLEIVSRVGKGSRFNIWFPVKRLILA